MNRTARWLLVPGALLAVLLAGVVTAGAGHRSRPHPIAAAELASLAVSAGAVHPVVLIGISGLRWSDVSAAGTPAIWQLAARGSVGSLVDTTIRALTCPADAWLTLNSGVRSAAKPPSSRGCPPLPEVRATAAGRSPRAAGPASVPGMTALERYNQQFSYQPAPPAPQAWGLLGTSAGPGRCATAIGPGAGLALAHAGGAISRYLPRLPAGSPARWTSCPLTVADLGALPPGGTRAGATARARAARGADHAVSVIAAAAAPGSIVVLAGLGGEPGQHLRVLIAAGPGFGPGLLTSASARQPGVAVITDLTPSILAWRGVAPGRALAGSGALAGKPLGSAGRGPLPAVIRGLISRDTAEQVYRGSVGWFLLGYGAGEGALFGLIALLMRGSAAGRVRARTAAYTAAAVLAAAVPAGTFLANLAPWPQLPHPALVLYGLGLAWAAVIAAAALAGPWRRAPFGPPGFVAAVTAGIVAVDVMTGSRLQLEAPFGLSLINANRFYGVGNSVLGVYGAAGLLAAAWAGVAAGGAGSRRLAAAAAGSVALGVVIASGWPGFGAKVGGTISMVPAFLVLLCAIAGVRITVRRGLAIAVSGLALAAAFALVSYLAPATGVSHQTSFAEHLLHGSVTGILRRKVSSNLSSLTETWFTPAVPVIAVATLLMLAWPARFRLRTLIRAQQAEPVLRAFLVAAWLAAALGWLADDSGVVVAGKALPFVLPTAIALVARTGAGPAAASPAAGARQPLAHWSGRARSDPAADAAG